MTVGKVLGLSLGAVSPSAVGTELGIILGTGLVVGNWLGAGL